MQLNELFSDLLTESESKLRQALKLYGKRVVDAIDTGHDEYRWPDNIAGQMFNLSANIRNALAAQPGEEGEQIIRYIKSFDPTPQGTYTLWMVEQWLSEHYKLEDLPRIHDYLDIFDRKRASITEKDIHRYETPQALFKAIQPFVGHAGTSMAQGSEKDTSMRDPSQTTVLLDDNHFRVVMPHTKESAAYWGGNTEWCIAWGVPGSRYPNRKDNYFDQYSNNGAFLIIYDKRKNENWALHLNPDDPTFWDQDDGSHDASIAVIRNTGWLKGRVVDVVRKTMPAEVEVALDPSVDAQRRAIADKPDLLAAFPDASDEMKLTAIRNSPSAIRHIANPSDEMKWAALNSDYNTIRFISDPSLDMQLMAIRNDPRIVDQILHVPEAAQLEAVRINGMALGSLMQDPYNIGRNRKVSPRVVAAAIRTAPNAIRYIHGAPKSLQMLAVSINGNALNSISTPDHIDPDVVEAAVKENKAAMGYAFSLSNITPEGRLRAYLVDPDYAAIVLRYNKPVRDELAALMSKNQHG
jgi:hypothetical protein